jgi:hypothetical protein
LIDETQKDAFFNQPGGVRLIDYKNLIIGAPMSDIKSVMAKLLGAPDREVILKSVNADLDVAFERVSTQRVGENEYRDFCQDVTIWFANEVNEGRQPLEEAKN